MGLFHLKLTAALIVWLSIATLTTSQPAGNETGDIIRWCDATPHPGPCKYCLKADHENDPPRNRTEFRKIMVQATMAEAVSARTQVLHLQPNHKHRRQRTVWGDCLKLHDNIILQLKRTLQGIEGINTSCSDFDLQTWLSTALTNIQTCQLGSRDLNVSSRIIRPAISTNLSQLISDSLAVNGVLLDATEREAINQTFPSWVTKHDRKLLQSSTTAVKANLVVAKDGSGNYRTIQAAIDAAARRTSTSSRFIIYVKRGIYAENIEVGNNNNNIMLVGDGIRYTIITGSRSVRGGYTTYSSATAGIDGLRFIARGITFRNTAGPYKGQAVALRSASDLSVFYRCGFEGYQDTLFVHSQRQFYRECYIYGTIDFIFGNAAVVFQNCLIYARRPLKGQANVITAQGRNDPYQNTGISIHNSQVLAAADLQPVVRAFKTYLGRPWQQYSRTVYMKTYLGSLVSPLGWSTWDGSNYALDTLYYGEYNNFGPSSSTKYRVKWKGYHIMSAAVASRFTVSSLIAGQSWLPGTGVPFASGL